MYPHPSPDAAALWQHNYPYLTYLLGLSPPPPPHAELAHRVTASRAAHSPLTPCGTMVPSREEVRGEGARGLYEKEEIGEFWARQGLVRSGLCYGVPQLPRPPSRLRITHTSHSHPCMPSPWQSSQRRCPQRPVRRLSGVVSSAETNGPHGRDKILSWQRRSPDPPPTTVLSAPYRGARNPRPGIVRAPPSRFCPSGR